MQSGNAVVVQNKMQNGGVGEREMGGKFWWNHHVTPGQQNFPPITDQRDGLLAWLREEFAAANAMIDALCHHLTVIGETGEYDEVIGCIAQRRRNWSPVLCMQHYFPVSEVLEALSRAGWRRQQRGAFERNGRSGREYHRKGGGRSGQRFDGFKGRKEMNSNNGSWSLDAADMKEKIVEDKEDIAVKPGADSSARKSESEPVGMNDKNTSISEGLQDKVNHTHSEPLQEGKQKVTIPKTFVFDEIVEGKTCNIVEGMKLYEELLDGSEVSRLTSLVNDLRTAGRRGQFDAQTFVVNKRPMNGHGREMIQFGVPIADAPPEAADGNVEPVPSLFQDVIEQLLAMEIVTVKPESCIIDIFNEGDYSQPHIFSHWFGRPVCVLFLTDCDLTFGKVISGDHPGDYRGSFNLSLKPGSVLTLQGRSADLTRHAIPSLWKQRILVTLVKSDPKRITSTTSSEHISLSGMANFSNRFPPPIRSPNHFRPTMGLKHYNPVVWPLPTAARSPLTLPNGIPTVLIPAPIAAPIPFPVPVALSPAANGGCWPAAVPPPPPPPRHPPPPPPRFPVPGTGVFLPQSTSGSSSSNQSVTAFVAASDSNGVESPSSVSENDNIPVVLNSNCESSNGEVDSNMKKPECFEGENENRQVKSTAEEGHY